MPILYGSRLRLRAPEREDIPAFLRWVNDPEVGEYLDHYTAFNREMEESWYESVVKGPAIELPHVIEVKTSENDTWIPIGNTAFMDFHQVNRSAEIGIDREKSIGIRVMVQRRCSLCVITASHAQHAPHSFARISRA